MLINRHCAVDQACCYSERSLPADKDKLIMPTTSNSVYRGTLFSHRRRLMAKPPTSLTL